MDIEKEFEGIKQTIIDTSAIARDYFNEEVDHNDAKEQKSDGSFVTRVEEDIETALTTYIRAHFPEDTIIGEEHGDYIGTSSFEWHIDPIDGTGNFLRRVPFFCVSVARLGDGPEDSFALVYNPITQQMFSSLMEDGAYVNERIAKLEAESLEKEKQVIAVGYGREKWTKTARYKLIEALGMKFGKSASYGSTALQLAYLSANRFDGQLTLCLNSFDYAAGLFLVKAAGGATSVLIDDTWQLWEGSIKELCSEQGRTLFSSHPSIHQEALDLMGNPKDWAEKK